jgi:hypothetical protein
MTSSQIQSERGSIGLQYSVGHLRRGPRDRLSVTFGGFEMSQLIAFEVKPVRPLRNFEASSD